MVEQDVQLSHVLLLVLTLVRVAPLKVALLVAGLGLAGMRASAPWDCWSPAYVVPKAGRRSEAVSLLREYRGQMVSEVVLDLVVERMSELRMRLPVFLEMGSQ